jgi:F-type H+-transporting ATPase subunit b
MATEAPGAAHGGEQAAGMPQLDFATYPNQIFWLVVALVAIYLILTRVALPRIGAVLAERKGTITNDLAAAEELKQKAKAAEAAYEKALADARAEAGRIVAEARADIQRELDAATAEADARIAARAAEAEREIAGIRANALASVTEVAGDTAREIVAALGGAADAARVEAAVEARLKG